MKFVVSPNNRFFISIPSSEMETKSEEICREILRFVDQNEIICGRNVCIRNELFAYVIKVMHFVSCLRELEGKHSIFATSI